MAAVRRTLIAVVAAVVTATPVGATSGDGLAESLRQAVVAQDFQDVLDLTPPGLTASRAGAPEKHDPLPAAEAARPVEPKPLHQTPNLDLAVIGLDPLGRPTAMADVLLSPQYPNGVVVPLDRRTLSTDQVRYRWWDDTEWDVNGGRGTRDVLAGREGAPI